MPPAHPSQLKTRSQVLSAVISDIVDSMRLAQPPLVVAPQAMDEKCYHTWLEHRNNLKQRANTMLHEHGGAPPHGALKRGSSSRGVTIARPALPPPAMPELPDGFNPHGHMCKAVSAEARAALTENVAATTVHKVCLRGPGGAGKTTMAVHLASDPAILGCFEAAAWVRVGDEPNLAALQAQLLAQWELESGAATAAAAAGAGEVSFKQPPTPSKSGRESHAAGGGGGGNGALKAQLRRATQGRRLLLVLDDVHCASDAAALCVLDDATTSACLYTSRIGGLFKGAVEISVGEMAPDEALALLLHVGQVEHLARDPPPAALAAVEACGRLPLALAVAGAMIEEHADDWTDWLEPTLAIDHAAELREHELPMGAALDGYDTGGGGGGGGGGTCEDEDDFELTLEGRVVLSSLDGLRDEAARSVFLHFAAFAPGEAVPICVFDAVATALLPPGAGTEGHLHLSHSHGGSRRRSTMVPPPSTVRKALLELARRSLLGGCIHHGFRMHPLIHSYVCAQGDLAADAPPLATAAAGADAGAAADEGGPISELPGMATARAAAHAGFDMSVRGMHRRILPCLLAALSEDCQLCDVEEAEEARKPSPALKPAPPTEPTKALAAGHRWRSAKEGASPSSRASVASVATAAVTAAALSAEEQLERYALRNLAFHAAGAAAGTGAADGVLIALRRDPVLSEALAHPSAAVRMRVGEGLCLEPDVLQGLATAPPPPPQS